MQDDAFYNDTETMNFTFILVSVYVHIFSVDLLKIY